MTLRTATLLVTLGVSVVVSCSSSQSRVIDGESHLMSPNVDVREIEYCPIVDGERFQIFTFSADEHGGRTRDSLWLMSRILLDRATHCVREKSKNGSLVVQEAIGQRRDKAVMCGGPTDVFVNVAPSGSASVEFKRSPNDVCLPVRCLRNGLDGLSLPGPSTARLSLTVIYTDDKLDSEVTYCSESN